MICVLPTHAGDVQALLRLLDWIAQLGGAKAHEALIVADAGTPFEHTIECLKRARTSFKSASVISTEREISGWIPGSNALWLAAAKHIEELLGSSAWFWMEADAVPLKPVWLDAIAKSY